jgi:hypothetical protein
MRVLKRNFLIGQFVAKVFSREYLSVLQTISELRRRFWRVMRGIMPSTNLVYYQLFLRSQEAIDQSELECLVAFRVLQCFSVQHIDGSLNEWHYHLKAIESAQRLAVVACPVRAHIK